MKKIYVFLLLTTIGVALYSFTKNDEYSEASPKDLTSYEVLYVKTIKDMELNVQLQSNFVRFFDRVNSIDVRFTADIGYFYAVYGVKDGNQVVKNLYVEKEDVENETYTYIDFSNISVDESTEYCYKGSSCNTCTYLPCCVDCNVLCGVWKDTYCEPF